MINGLMKIKEVNKLSKTLLTKVTYLKDSTYIVEEIIKHNEHE